MSALQDSSNGNLASTYHKAFVCYVVALATFLQEDLVCY